VWYEGQKTWMQAALQHERAGARSRCLVIISRERWSLVNQGHAMAAREALQRCEITTLADASLRFDAGLVSAELDCIVGKRERGECPSKCVNGMLLS
jgi:hypothetical protein